MSKMNLVWKIDSEVNGVKGLERCSYNRHNSCRGIETLHQFYNIQILHEVTIDIIPVEELKPFDNVHK